jgi:hypothetical protein
MGARAAINVWMWSGVILASIAIGVLLGLILQRYAARKYDRERAATPNTKWEEEQAQRMRDETNRRLLELESKAQMRKIWVDGAKQLFRGLPFIVAAFFFALSTHDHLVIIASIFLGLGGWFMMML